MRRSWMLAVLLIPATSTLAQERPRRGCLGVRLEDECDTMLLYEAGFRGALLGSVEKPRPGSTKGQPYINSHMFFGTGVMFRAGPTRAIGVAADIGNGQESILHTALGVRLAQDLAGPARADFTAGGVMVPGLRNGERKHFRHRSFGMFGEAVYQANGYVGISARAEIIPETERTSAETGIFLGARVDGRPGLRTTFVAAGLLGLAIAYFMLGGGGGS